MKKILSLLVLSFIVTGVASAHSTFLVEVPSTFVIKLGEGAGVKNYQNMDIDLVEITTANTDCDTKAGTPCPLGNPVNTANPKKAVLLNVSTPGGCGPNADSRCLGAPAFGAKLKINEGSSSDALGVNIKVTSVSEGSATLSVSFNTTDDSTIHPLPPETNPTPGVIPVGRDFGNRGNGTDDGVSVGGQGSVKVNAADRIIICPNGEADDNCSVCSKGDCRPETTPASPRKLGEPTDTSGSPVVRLNSDESFVSAVKVEGSSSTSTAYEVKAKRKARLLFLFPVNPEITYSVTANGSSTVSNRPWWNFLAW